MKRARAAGRSVCEPDVFGDLAAPCAALARSDAALARALDAIGAPHIRRRADGFEGLFRIIVEQQVSVPSAQAIWARIRAALDVADPAAVAAVGPDGLRALGLTRQKSAYVADLAAATDVGAFRFDASRALDDADALAHFQSVRGVGPWTAAIYLLFCEGRVDIWPPRDVALKGAYNAAGDDGLDQATLDERAQSWTPHRGVAAHILWTYYAVIRGRAPI